MRPCWKPDSSPLRSDQGESRTPMPVKARRSERRVSAGSTTWPISSPYGNRTHPSGLRGRRPFADRRTGRQCVGQELNLHSKYAAALKAVGLANAQPAHGITHSDAFCVLLRRNVRQTRRAYLGANRATRQNRRSSVRYAPAGSLAKTNGKHIALIFSSLPSLTSVYWTRTNSSRGSAAESQHHRNDGYS
jgi:hypothetical protein